MSWDSLGLGEELGYNIPMEAARMVDNTYIHLPCSLLFPPVHLQLAFVVGFGRAPALSTRPQDHNWEHNLEHNTEWCRCHADCAQQCALPTEA